MQPHAILSRVLSDDEQDDHSAGMCKPAISSKQAIAGPRHQWLRPGSPIGVAMNEKLNVWFVSEQAVVETARRIVIDVRNKIEQLEH